MMQESLHRHSKVWKWAAENISLHFRQLP